MSANLDDFIVRLGCLQDLTYIDYLQKKNAEQLSYYPLCVFEREIPLNRILLAEYNSEPCGYLYRGAFSERLKIHQACIQYDLRGKLYGAALVGALINASEDKAQSIHLRCGSDIEANGFWRAMGFYCEGVTQGGVRRMRDINAWRLDIQPPLFTTHVEPSEKKQDASKWRKRDKTIKLSQFSRGKKMDDYRSRVLNESEGK